ncbi:hypothetical protein MBM09_08515 [Flaviramulus sp. BrNp1-15]|uniref:hypothetical protein n=1 Tax=Flaviramulus sp. BrNp1-15 TaxID=2916754 RepID=UPI001EE98AB1|nr:hypothetical protein [Flaviramulus sp. BrNp1-15]ULC57961.1 hypothetical protein MBM09_08515 [Flaviramulus sp. BrNp1-15]
MVEVISALTGVFLFRKYKESISKYFILFLVYLNICEFLASYTRFVFPDKFLNFLVGSLIEKNYWWSTLYWKIGAIMFFVFYYRKILKNKRFNKIVKLASYTFFIFSIIYILFHWKAFFVSYFPIISVLGAIIVFLCTVFYFIEILQSEKVLTFYKSLNFYISAAIFVWWLIITPIVFYDNYTSYEVGIYERDWDYIKLRRLLYLSANIIMYLTFTFALIFCKPEYDLVSD